MAYTSSQVVQAVPTGINSALVFIAGGTLTTAASNSINNCFSATYTAYKIILYDIINSSVGSNFTVRLGTSGTPDTSSQYYLYGTWVYSGGASASGQEAASAWRTMYQADASGSMVMDIIQPFEASKTYCHYQASSNLSYYNTSQGSGFINTSTSYTDFNLYANTGTYNISSKYKIYGYTNS